MSILDPETIAINSDDPVSLARALERAFAHIEALHKDVGLLSIAIGTLVNAGDAGVLAKPNAARDILSTLLDHFEKDAPAVAVQVRVGLGLPLGSFPPDRGARLKIVQGGKKAA